MLNLLLQSAIVVYTRALILCLVCLIKYLLFSYYICSLFWAVKLEPCSEWASPWYLIPRNAKWCSSSVHGYNTLHWFFSAITFYEVKLWLMVLSIFPSSHPPPQNSTDLPTGYAISIFLPLIHLISLLSSSLFHFPMTEPPKWNPKNPTISS